MLGEILYARHGESLWNAAGRWQGQADPPLSARGREQARSLAVRLADRAVARLAASDLARARETAQIVGAALGVAPRLLPALRELDAGTWAGLRHDEVARRWPEALRLFRSGAPDAAAGGGETRAALRTRIAAALRELAAAPPRGTLLVVGHLGALRALQPGADLPNGAFQPLAELPA